MISSEHRASTGPIPTWTPSFLEPTAPLTSFKATSTAVYAKHSPGLWQPMHSPVFIVMMSTFDPTGPNFSGTVFPLAHCSSLHDAQRNLAALAQHCGVGKVTQDVNWPGHYFELKSKTRMRSFWIREVPHATSLKMMDLDEFDGGLNGVWSRYVYVREPDKAFSSHTADAVPAVACKGTAVDGESSDEPRNRAIE